MRQLRRPYDHIEFEDSDATDHRVFFEKLFAYPGQELRAHLGSLSDGVRICIVGGGIAGLVAACEVLSWKRTANVVVLEGSPSLGGRVRTFHFSPGHLDGPGPVGELGAMRIPDQHAGVRHYVKELGLDGLREPFVTYNQEALIYYGKEPPVKRSEHTLLLKHLKLDPGIADPTENLQGQLEGPKRYLRSHLFDPFLDDGEADPAVRQCDRITLWQYMCDPDARASLVRCMGKPSVPAALRDEAWEWVGRVSGHLWFEKGTLMQSLLDLAYLTDTPEELGVTGMWHLAGGMDQLVHGLERKIVGMQGKILCDARVTEMEVRPWITSEDRGEEVFVRWKSEAGGFDTQAFDYVICTVPPVALWQIVFRPSLGGDARRAITNVTSESLAKSAVLYKTRWWEKERGIAAGTSYTDLGIQQVVYPSDNAEHSVVHRDTWLVRDQGTSSTPGVLVAYMWAGNARRFAAIDPLDRTQYVVDSIDRVHHGEDPLTGEPAERHRHEVLDVSHALWDVASPLGAGFTLFGPGEVSRYQAAMCAPYPAPEGNRVRPPRVFFAGEHLGVMHGWIQAAVSSSWSALIELGKSAETTTEKLTSPARDPWRR